MAKATQTKTTKKTTTKLTFSNPFAKSTKSTGKKRCPTCGKYMGGAK